MSRAGAAKSGSGLAAAAVNRCTASAGSTLMAASAGRAAHPGNEPAPRQPRRRCRLIPEEPGPGPRLRGGEDLGQSRTDAGRNSHPGKNPSLNPCAGGEVL